MVGASSIFAYLRHVLSTTEHRLSTENTRIVLRAVRRCGGEVWQCKFMLSLCLVTHLRVGVICLALRFSFIYYTPKGTYFCWSQKLMYVPSTFSYCPRKHTTIMGNTVFWEVTPCSLVAIYEGVGGTCCFRLQEPRIHYKDQRDTAV